MAVVIQCSYCENSFVWLSETKWIDGKLVHKPFLRECFDTTNACADCSECIENEKTVLIEKNPTENGVIKRRYNIKMKLAECGFYKVVAMIERKKEIRKYINV